VVREVELVPRRGWGGEGALGAVLGFGALHRLPVGLGEEVQAPGEKLFDAGYDEKKSSGHYGNSNGSKAGQFLVPVELKTPMQISPTSPPMLSPNVPPPPMTSPNAPPASSLTPSVARHGKKGRPHGPVSPKAGFDDMFSEFTAKSKEEDYVPSRKGTPLPPPPKVGELIAAPPPRASSPEKVTKEEIGEPGEAEES
jgi:hypothetical protein